MNSVKVIVAENEAKFSLELNKAYSDGYVLISSYLDRNQYLLGILEHISIQQIRHTKIKEKNNV